MQLYFYVFNDKDKLVKEIETTGELIPNIGETITFKNYDGAYRVVDKKIFYGYVTVPRIILKKIKEEDKSVESDDITLAELIVAKEYIKDEKMKSNCMELDTLEKLVNDALSKTIE